MHEIFIRFLKLKIYFTCTFRSRNVRTCLKTKQHSTVFCTAFNIWNRIFTFAMASIIGECERSWGRQEGIKVLIKKKESFFLLKNHHRHDFARGYKMGRVHNTLTTLSRVWSFSFFLFFKKESRRKTHL